MNLRFSYIQETTEIIKGFIEHTLLAKHLSVPKTKKLYPNEIEEILDAIKNS